MKHFLLFLILALSVFILNRIESKYNFLDKGNNFPELQSSASYKIISDKQIKETGRGGNGENLDPHWYSDAVENIENEEYNVSYSEELKSYQSPNRANNIRFIYHKDGFTAKTRKNKIALFDLNDKTIREEEKNYKEIPEWSIRFKTSSVKRETDSPSSENVVKSMNVGSIVSERSKNPPLFAGSEVMINKNKASVEDENVRIDYTNTEEGMRQDFLIKNKPYGEGKLKLELSAETNLRMTLEEDALNFKDNSGNVKMKYSSLKVWDANGKDLKAYFDHESQIMNEELNGNSNDKIKNPKSKIVNIIPKSHISNSKSFSIVVNDEDAIYPITIDPLSTSPNWIGEGDQGDAALGYSVSSAGDVNADGFSDVIIGAFLHDNGHTNEGKAFVYYGSILGLLPAALWAPEGNQTGAQFGYSVSSAGDVNGDGYSDVIVGANIYDNDQTDEGRVFVYHGSLLGLSSTPSWIGESNQGGSQYGWTVSTAGDVNDDGYSDVIVGAPLYDNGQTDEGRSFIYYGSLSGLSATANWTAESNQGTAMFGYSVSTAGDVNGDGYSDVIVGANRFDTPILDEGRAFVYYGSSTGLSFSSNWTSESYPQGFFVYYGNSVSTAGDVNDDGYSDVIVGAYSYDNGQPDEGKVFVYHGSASGLPPIVTWTVESNQPYARFGNSVSTAGDVNNDGYSDVVIGASEYDNGESNEGSAFVYYGSSTGLSSLANWTGENNQANSLFGISVSTAGDVNNDGFDDVIVGAYLYDNGQSNEGGAFVYHGSTGGQMSLTLTMYMQGFYNFNTNMLIQDTVNVFLRNSIAPYTIVDSAKAFINSAGKGTFWFTKATNGINYYLQIKHRNSLETWSASAISFSNNILNFNLSTSISQAFGNNMMQIDSSPLRFAIFSGDVNQDGIIDGSDLSQVDNAANNSVSGYVRTDVNGDGFVDASDLSIVDNNVYNSVILKRP